MRCLLAIRGTGDEAHLREQFFSELLHLLILHQGKLLEESVSGLGGFPGIVVALVLQEFTQTLLGFQQEIAQFTFEIIYLRRSQWFLERSLLVRIEGIFLVRFEGILSVLLEGILNTDDVPYQIFEHSGAGTESGQLIDGKDRTRVVPVVIFPVIIHLASCLLQLFIGCLYHGLHLQVKSRLVVLALAAPSHAGGSQAYIMRCDDGSSHIFRFQCSHESHGNIVFIISSYGN